MLGFGGAVQYASQLQQRSIVQWFPIIGTTRKLIWFQVFHFCMLTIYFGGDYEECNELLSQIVLRAVSLR